MRRKAPKAARSPGRKLPDTTTTTAWTTSIVRRMTISSTG
jgi:hypothetical protein